MANLYWCASQGIPSNRPYNSLEHLLTSLDSEDSYIRDHWAKYADDLEFSLVKECDGQATELWEYADLVEDLTTTEIKFFLLFIVEAARR